MPVKTEILNEELQKPYIQMQPSVRFDVSKTKTCGVMCHLPVFLCLGEGEKKEDALNDTGAIVV